jgi:hypothetical protein
MSAGEGACSRGKRGRDQCASILDRVSTIGIADGKQGPVLPMRFGMKRKIFSGGDDEGDADLFAVSLMPLASMGSFASFDCRLVFAMVFVMLGVGGIAGVLVKGFAAYGTPPHQ